MVDYYEREWASPAAELATGQKGPRCRAHRDFGSITLVFTHSPGLQAQVASEASTSIGLPEGSDLPPWQDVAVPGPTSALLLFGWCTQIRSNGRLHAVQHRVSDPPEPDQTTGRSPRRTSAVFFLSPRDMQAPLTPVVLDGEVANYVPGVSAEAQMMYNMANPVARAKQQRAAAAADQ